MSVAANTSSQHNLHERRCQYEQPAPVSALALRALKPRLITCNKLYNKFVQAFEVTPHGVRATSVSTSVYALALAVLKPRLITCNKLYNSFVQAFEVTPYEVRATSISTSVYALALGFEATSYHVQQLYNPLYRPFIATSYHACYKLYTILYRAVDAALCSHEFTLECVVNNVTRIGHI